MKIGAKNSCGVAGVARKAFTMAEILLSLTIIGVVAAITLPSLTGNINERTWNTQRKAFYARVSQAVALMPALNGHGTADYENAAENFITSQLSKVLKINNICDNAHFSDCGIASKYTTLRGTAGLDMPTTLSELHPTLTARSAVDVWNGSGVVIGTISAFSQTDVKAVAFETQNGESVVAFYNPSCRSNMEEMNPVPGEKMCLNLVYDLNGTKGPNTVGKDIGVLSVFYPSDSIVTAPMPNVNDANSGSGVAPSLASGKCTEQDSESRLPNRDELYALYINSKLFDRNSDRYWSSSTQVIPYGAETNRVVIWHVGMDNGVVGWDVINSTTNNYKVLCVKR